jgi:hypothetical protein
MDSVIRTSNNLDLCDAMRISENDADLRRSSTLLCKLADLVDDLLGSGLQPRRRSSRVWDGRGRYALSVAVKTTHGDESGEAEEIGVDFEIKKKNQRGQKL